MACSIHPSFLQEIPNFIIDSIAYCDCLIFKRNEKSCFVLAKNLKFYEFRNKQLLHSLDLNETCLSSIRKEIETYGNKSFSQKNELSADASNDSLSDKLKIKIGKYIYRNFEISKLYLTLHCWDKLIIIEHSHLNGMKLNAEYERVASFKMVPNTLIKYQAQVKMQFDDGTFTCSDFQENCNNATDSDRNGHDKVTQKSEFKHILDRVRTTKAELQLHKEITQKQFQNVYNAQNFGNNFLRSTKLEEKFMLSKCGDLWMRVTATDELVLGLPLVNNCAPPNLTILKNLQPVININKESTIKAEEKLKNLHFEHQLYRLQQTFENLETLETLFQTQDIHFEGESTWQRETSNELQPNSFIVLLLKFKLSQLILINEPCQFFVGFEVKKDLETLEPKIEMFEQHLFIKTLNFQQIMQNRSLYEIHFHEQTLHQDLLALAMISHDTKLRIEFVTQNDFEKFEHLLATKFDFNTVHRSVNSNNSCDDTSMDIDERDETAINFTGTLFYNSKPNSLWYGSLALRRAVSNTNVVDGDEPLQTDWIFYTRNEEKSYLMLKFLFDDLISLKCNINSINYAKYQRDVSSKLISFENAIREELNSFSELCKVNDSQKFKEKFEMLAKYQFQTDLIANEL